MASFGDWQRLSKSLLLALLAWESKVAGRMRYELTRQGLSTGWPPIFVERTRAVGGGTGRQDELG
jgi:hypothetical protein